MSKIEPPTWMTDGTDVYVLHSGRGTDANLTRAEVTRFTATTAVVLTYPRGRGGDSLESRFRLDTGKAVDRGDAWTARPELVPATDSRARSILRRAKIASLVRPVTVIADNGRLRAKNVPVGDVMDALDDLIRAARAAYLALGEIVKADD